MQLVTPELHKQLIANGKRRDGDHVPVVKFFNPIGAATWLVTDMDPDEHDHIFGLADLGMGFPELGWISLSELQDYKGPLGLGIERDLYFKPRYPISVYAEAARAARRIVETGPLLEEAARTNRASVDNASDTATDESDAATAVQEVADSLLADPDIAARSTAARGAAGRGTKP